MRDRFPGHYRPSKKEFDELWASALIVPDTNVLLALYRLSEPTRQKLLEVLEKLQDRLFVPHQVAYEFQIRRLDVIKEQEVAYDSVDKQLQGFARTVGETLREHPRLDKKDLEKQIEEAIAPVRDQLRDAREGHPDPLTGNDALGPDSVRDVLDPLIADRIGPPRDLAEIAKEGAARYEREQPPGWEDQKKPEPQCYGDLAIWLDAIDKAEKDKKPVILVTQERKEDWWWVRNGKTIGPQPELVEEMWEKAKQPFYLYGLDGFMEKASETLGIEFSDDDRVDVARAQPAESEGPQPIVSDIASYTIPPTLASGTLQLSDFPDGIKWGDSLLSGTPAPALRFTTFNQPQRWHHSADVDGDRATLTIEWKPQFYGTVQHPKKTFTCTVISPGGETLRATCSGTPSRAQLIYPDEFGEEAASEPGQYKYFWANEVDNYIYLQGAVTQTHSSPEIARGEFELR